MIRKPNFDERLRQAQAEAAAAEQVVNEATAALTEAKKAHAVATAKVVGLQYERRALGEEIERERQNKLAAQHRAKQVAAQVALVDVEINRARAQRVEHRDLGNKPAVAALDARITQLMERRALVAAGN